MRRVVQYTRHGDSSVLEVATVPVPSRRRGEVLLENKCAGVNPKDYKLREGIPGLGGWLVNPRLPAIPGADVAGVVAEADEGSAFKPGDRVFAQMAWDLGGYASKVVVPEKALARIPEGMSFEEAASMPLVALTGWQALELAGLKEGQRVLIHAGAGGVGTYAIQIAKAWGLHVATTCSADHIEYVRGLGADEVVDYKKEKFEEVYKDRPFDAVLDPIVLNGYQQRSMSVLKRSGTYVNIMPTAMLGQIAWGMLKGALGLAPRYRMERVVPNGEQLANIADLYRQGKLKPVVADVLPLERAAEAQDRSKMGHTCGKLVLKIAE